MQGQGVLLIHHVTAGPNQDGSSSTHVAGTDGVVVDDETAAGSGKERRGWPRHMTSLPTLLGCVRRAILFLSLVSPPLANLEALKPNSMAMTGPCVITEDWERDLTKLNFLFERSPN